MCIRDSFNGDASVVFRYRLYSFHACPVRDGAGFYLTRPPKYRGVLFELGGAGNVIEMLKP